MIETGQNLGHKITAEGIEKEEQLNMPQELYCAPAQGYFFSNPVSANQISKLFTKNLTC